MKMSELVPLKVYPFSFNLTLLHSERPKLYGVLAIVSAIVLKHMAIMHFSNSLFI